MQQTPSSNMELMKQYVQQKPTTPSYKAFLVGGTGATGVQLLNELLMSALCSHVVILVRRTIDVTELPNAGKLKQIVVNDSNKFFDHDHLTSLLQPEIQDFDVAFSCFGTSKKKAGGAENWVKIDPDMNKFFGRLAFRLANIHYYSIVSSIGANADSSFLYVKGKGEIEQELDQYMKEQQNQNGADIHSNLAIFRPSLLLAERENRPFYAVPTQYIAPVISSALFGSLRKYRAIDVKDVAKAMRIEFEANFTCQQRASGTVIYESDLIQQIADLETAENNNN